MKKDNIESVVFSYFVRAIKDDGKYMLFRRGLHNDGLIKALLRNNRRNYPTPDTPFSTASCVKDVVETLKRITNEMAKNNGNSNGAADLDRYEHVTMTINHLLHFFLEVNGVSIDKLCSLGEEIYGNSCYKLFGDDYDSLKEREEEEKAKIENEEQKNAKLFQEYINGIKKGEIDKNMPFDDFIKKHKKGIFDKIDSWGQVLGKVPSANNEFIRAIDSDWDSYLWDMGWRTTNTL